MRKLRDSWLISYLIIAAFGGLTAFQGCGGGSYSPEIYADRDQGDNSIIQLSLPDPINFQIPDDLSSIRTEVNLEQGVVSLNNGNDSIDVRLNGLSPSREHTLRMPPIKLPWRSNYGQGNMYAAGYFDTGHDNPNSSHPELNKPHFNYYVYDDLAGLLDSQVIHLEKAVIDLHVYVMTECPYLLYGRSVKDGLNPNAKGFKHWDKELIQCSDPKRKPTQQEITETAMKVMQDIIESARDFTDTLNAADKVVFTIALIAGLALALYYAWPFLSRAIVVLFELIAAGLTGAALEVAFVAAMNGNNDDNTVPPPPDNNGGDGDDNDGNENDDDNDYQGGPPNFPDIPPDNPGGNGNDQNDQTPPVVVRENSRVELLGNDRFKLEVKFADLGDHPSGFNSAYLQLQDPSYQFHGIGGRNDSNPVILEVSMTGRDVGIWKVFAWAKDNAGNDSVLTDTGLRIAWGAPWIERRPR